MYLTKAEERILDGEYGEGKRIAMELIVKVGEALGAERLVDISHAHVSGVSYDNIGEYGLEFIEALAKKGARFTVFTTFNPVGIVLGKDPGLNEPERVAKQAKIIKLLLRMGARYSATCIPYTMREPKLGEHLAWGESSAVVVANTLYGARTNREGGPIALAAAIVGKTYYWGLHLDENRVPDVKVVVERDAVRGEASAGALGYIVATYYPSAKPLIYGFPPKKRLAIAACAAAAAQGAVAICFIEGLSPEFKRASKEVVSERMTITKDDVVKAMKELSCSEDDPRLLFVGCPHYTKDDVKRILRSLQRFSQRLWIAVPGASWHELVREVKMPTKVDLLPGTCIVVTKRSLLPQPIATNSVKAVIYLCKAGVKARLIEVEDNE